MSDRAAALGALLEELTARGYTFVTPTPATHARVAARKEAASDLRDVFGWSLPFAPDLLEAPLLSLLHDADVLEQRGPLLRSLVRVSSLGGDLLLHSAFPTTHADSVFFGPDSYRFAQFLRAALAALPAFQHIADVGAGAGAGAIAVARAAPPAHVTLTDINPAALELARINWRHARLGSAAFIECDSLSAVATPIDCIVANPPYIADAAHRAYRDGGDMHGAAMSVRWASDAARRLEPGGAFLLYTGSAIVGGEDRLRAALSKTLHAFEVQYRELDPDVFGEELDRDGYADVERIAVIGLIAVKR